jgi:uncharacterized beta-barrel protein YwiB (DUF1934 family)
MQTCDITIVTNADGQETSVSKTGVWSVLPNAEISLQYEETNAKICMTVGKDEVRVDRTGDYTLSLLLKQGKRCEGKIGIGGNEGKVFTQTKKLERKEKDGSLLLILHYDLLIGDEPQKMKLRLHAKKLKD